MRVFRASVRLCCEPLPRLDRRSDPDLIETREDSLWSMTDPTVIRPPTTDRRDPRWVPSDRHRPWTGSMNDWRVGMDWMDVPSTHPIIPLDHSREREVQTDRKGTRQNTTTTKESLIACATRAWKCQSSEQGLKRRTSTVREKRTVEPQTRESSI